MPVSTQQVVTPNQPQHIHNVFVGLLGEMIGISLLAVLADSNEELGRVLVAVMIGWFLIFLMVNAGALQGLMTKVGFVQPGKTTLA